MALVLLMGIPGSGKTELSRKLRESFGDSVCTVFSYDDIFNDDGFVEHIWGEDSVGGSMVKLYGLNAESRNARSERKRCEYQIQKFLKAQFYAEGGNVFMVTVVDDIFYLKSMRRPFRKMSSKFNLSFLTVLVDVPVEKALIQNMQRCERHQVPESTIRKIYEEMELPSGNDDFFRYQSENDLQTLLLYISSIKKSKEAVKNVTATIVSKNEGVAVTSNDGKWCELELNLRKCVAELIREKSIGKGGVAKLAEIKKKLYAEMRISDDCSWNKIMLKDNMWKQFQTT